MRWFQKSDRDLDAFAEAIRPELSALRVPQASDELRDRILADRAAGARVILPAERDARSSLPRYLVAAVLVIAALLVLPIYRVTRDDTRDAELTASLSYFGGVARAQEPPTAPSLPPALPTRTDRLHAGTLEYLRVWHDSAGRLTKQVTNRLTVTAEGDTWRVVDIGREATAKGAAITAESLIVARRDFRLLSRAVHVRPYRRWNGINIEQHLNDDSVAGRMTLDDVTGMRPIAQRLRPAYAPYLADVFAPVYFSAVPLDRQWVGRVSVLGWAVVPTNVFVPVEMRVIGEEQVQVPAGRFDCWKLDVRYAGGEFEYWVRKSDGIGVRTLEHQRDGVERLVTLQRESRM